MNTSTLSSLSCNSLLNLSSFSFRSFTIKSFSTIIACFISSGFSLLLLAAYSSLSSLTIWTLKQTNCILKGSDKQNSYLHLGYVSFILQLNFSEPFYLCFPHSNYLLLFVILIFLLEELLFHVSNRFQGLLLLHSKRVRKIMNGKLAHAHLSYISSIYRFLLGWDCSLFSAAANFLNLRL